MEKVNGKVQRALDWSSLFAPQPCFFCDGRHRSYMGRVKGHLLPGMRLLVALVLPAWLLTSCGGASLTPGYLGKTMSYTPGFPDFDMAAVEQFAGQVAGIEVYLSVPNASLTFLKEGDRFVARYEVSARLLSATDRRIFEEVVWQETTWVADYGATRSGDGRVVARHLAANPGRFLVGVRLEDLSTGKRSYRQEEIAVPNTVDGQPHLGELRMMRVTGTGRTEPALSFFFRTQVDSLHAEARLYNVPGRRITVTAALSRFRADTSVAAPPFAYALLNLPAGYGGWKVGRSDTVFSERVPLTPAERDQQITVALPRVDKGIYLLELESRVGGSGAQPDTLLRRDRVLSIQGPSFPRPSLLSELVEAMRYILRPREIRTFDNAADVGQRKRLFDSLWLSFTRDANASSQLLSRYYSRVEEANRLFTGTKEGWRTDRGMVYIVMGPPEQVEGLYDTQTWRYSLSGNQTYGSFVFKRVLASASDDLTFEQYVLYRDAMYEQLWDRMVTFWRTGRVF